VAESSIETSGKLELPMPLLTVKVPTGATVSRTYSNTS